VNCLPLEHDGERGPSKDALAINLPSAPCLALLLRRAFYAITPQRWPVACPVAIDGEPEHLHHAEGAATASAAPSTRLRNTMRSSIDRRHNLDTQLPAVAREDPAGHRAGTYAALVTSLAALFVLAVSIDYRRA
jgi:hypothetical protein